jgi:hypothetical protein
MYRAILISSVRVHLSMFHRSPWLTIPGTPMDPWDLLFPMLQNHLWMPRKKIWQRSTENPRVLTKVRNANYRNMQRQGLPAKRKCILEYHRLSQTKRCIFHCHVWLLEGNPPLFQSGNPVKIGRPNSRSSSLSSSTELNGLTKVCTLGDGVGCQTSKRFTLW